MHRLPRNRLTGFAWTFALGLAVTAVHSAEHKGEPGFKHLRAAAARSLAVMPARSIALSVKADEDAWVGTGAELDKGVRYRIAAKGRWRVGGLCNMTDAKGENAYTLLCFPTPLFPPMVEGKPGSALIGKIGVEGTPFFVGSELVFSADRQGELFLRINDTLGAVWDNSGEMSVSVVLDDPSPVGAIRPAVAVGTPGSAVVPSPAMPVPQSPVPAVPTATHRLALVIGNANYQGAPLRNPVNDARAIATTLKELGFEVIERFDSTQKEMYRAVTLFGEKLTADTVGLFYYAGHGMQVRGTNYLIPVDAQIRAEGAVKTESIDVDAVLEQFTTRGSRLNLVILDACRNNPFERRFRGGSGGLAQIDAPQGTLIAYATAPGKVASDGDGVNGLYTSELLQAMRRSGAKIEDVFKEVRINVSRETNGLQTPWESSSLIGDFYFVPRAPVTTATVGAPAQVSIELAFWDAIKDSRNPADYRAYLERFPNGNFAPLARSRIAQFESAAPATRR